jgi:hypothetical protein
MKSKLYISFFLISLFSNCLFTDGNTSYWSQDNPKYNDYPLHTAPTFAGVSDGAIEEITGTAQLVKLGLEITTDKEKATALWESVKNINFSAVKEAATGAIKEKWDKYANSPNYITYHEIGKDGVQIASLLYGGFATKGKKLSEAVEESGDIIGKRIRKFTQKEIDDYVNLATKNPEAKKVMLGKYVEDATSYIKRAGNSHAYFDMGDEWNKAKALVNNSDDEMWRINKQFIRNAKKDGKEFFFSHDPRLETDSFLKDEYDFLIELGGKKDLIKIENNLWKMDW